MDARHWLRELRQELVRRKLPRRYVDRLVMELSEHLSDVTEDAMRTDAHEPNSIVDRLGTPGQLAERAATEYSHGRFSARHPWLTFVGLPVVLLPLLWSSVALVLIAVVYGAASLFTFDAPFPLWGKLAVVVTAYAMIDLPILLSAALICRLASRADLHWKWPMIGCGLLALVSAQVCPVVRVNTADAMWSLFFLTPYFDLGHGQYLTSTGTSLMTATARATQVFQFTLPLVVGALAVWRHVGSAPTNHARLPTVQNA